MNFRFTYPISRQFPNRYFTPFVILIFIFATVILSLFNAIANGYELRVSYTSKPNATIAKKLWYDRPAFGKMKKAKLSPSCEPKELSLRQKFNTDKNGLVYTITGIKKIEGDVVSDSPSLLYLNNPLENCTVNYIKVELESASRTAQQVGWSRWAPNIFSAISCSVVNDVGQMRFNITTEYDLVPSTAVTMYMEMNETSWANAAQQNLYQFANSNNAQNPAMWWAESLMSFSWVTLAKLFEDYNNESDLGFLKGTINYFNSMQTSDILKSNFFDIVFYFLRKDEHIYYGENIFIEEPALEARMFIASDRLAKAFYSAILADLGDANGPNILTDESKLQSFTSNFSNVDVDWVPVGPANNSYKALRDFTGEPQINRSTIVTNYLCQTPVPKVAISLVVAVLLANIVFLRALWLVVMLTAGYFVERNDPKANWCLHCIDVEKNLIPTSALTSEI